MTPQRRRKQSRNARKSPASGADFWGTKTAADGAERIARAADPTTMVESLGAVPLPGRETLAALYFAGVYDKAAALATALAAAADLLELGEPDDL